MTEYEFLFVGGNANAYLFKTSHGLFYEVKFKPTPYLFADQPEVADNVFELVIQLVQNVAGKTPPDPLIPFTIAAICKDFFEHQERVLVYICDTSDYRQSARVRKFNVWFDAFNDNEYIKVDAQFPDRGSIVHYVSLILRWDHPFLNSVVSAFKGLSDLYRGDKP